MTFYVITGGQIVSHRAIDWADAMNSVAIFAGRYRQPCWIEHNSPTYGGFFVDRSQPADAIDGLYN